jgi:hypothetical protein
MNFDGHVVPLTLAHGCVVRNKPEKTPSVSWSERTWPASELHTIREGEALCHLCAVTPLFQNSFERFLVQEKQQSGDYPETGPDLPL